MKPKNRTYKRNHSKRRYPPRKPVLKRFRVTHTVKQFVAMSPEIQDRWIQVTHVISKMRADHISLREASREFGLDPRIVARLGKSAFRKRKDGRYIAKRTDKLLRILAVPTPDGTHEIALRDSREASRLGKYWVAVQKYLQTGDDSALKKFHRKHITDASGKKIPLVLDTAVLDQLGSAGVLSFESLYAKTA